MEILLIALSPFFVALMSQGAKKLVSKKLFTNGFRKNILRLIVAALSYVAIIGNAMLTDGSVDLVATETFVETLVTFLAATGTYFFAKK